MQIIFLVRLLYSSHLQRVQDYLDKVVGAARFPSRPGFCSLRPRSATRKTLYDSALTGEAEHLPSGPSQFGSSEVRTRSFGHGISLIPPQLGVLSSAGLLGKAGGSMSAGTGATLP